VSQENWHRIGEIGKTCGGAGDRSATIGDGGWTMKKNPRPLLTSAAIFAAVGVLIMVFAGRMFADMAGTDLAFAVFALVLGLFFVGIGGYFVWGFFYLKRQG
jgi:hypothetical protein